MIRKDKQFILNFLSVIGVGITMATTIKDTTKACKLVDEDMTLREKIKRTWKCYIPSCIIATSTILCIIYSDKVTMNEKIALFNALSTAQNNYKNIRENINEVCDEQTKKEINKNLIKDKVPKDLYIDRTGEKIFYEEYRGQFFSSTIDNVLKAEYKFNKHLSIIGKASLNDFYKYLGLSDIDSGDRLGWTIDYGYTGINETNPWVDFEHSKMEDDDGCEYYYLNYSNHPIFIGKI